jgi:hypothetical protein
MRRSKACRLPGRLKDTLLSAMMQVAIFLSARHLLTRFQGRSLVYTLEGPSRFVLGIPNPEYQDLLSYVPPVATEWHTLIVESYIQSDVRGSNVPCACLVSPVWGGWHKSKS